MGSTKISSGPVTFLECMLTCSSWKMGIHGASAMMSTKIERYASTRSACWSVRARVSACAARSSIPSLQYRAQFQPPGMLLAQARMGQ